MARGRSDFLPKKTYSPHAFQTCSPFPNMFHHFSIISLSYDLYFPIMFPSCSHHVPIIVLSFSHHFPNIFQSCYHIFSHMFPYMFLSFSHHFLGESSHKPRYHGRFPCRGPGATVAAGCHGAGGGVPPGAAAPRLVVSWVSFTCKNRRKTIGKP